MKDFSFKELIDLKIKGVLDQYKNIKGNLDPPIDLKLIRKICKCQILAAPKSVSYEGLLIPVKRGFLIRYRENLWKRRRRLTICHEVAHTFFYDTNYFIPKKFIKHSKEEDICFEAARKILVPEESLRIAFSNEWSGENGIYSIMRLSNLFECSLGVMAHRLTADISLLQNEMITFWRYKSTKPLKTNVNLSDQLNYSYEDFKKESKLSPSLVKYFPPYQRLRYIYKKIWPLIEEYIKNRVTKKASIDFEWKRKVEGKMKYEKIKVFVELSIWEGSSEESWKGNNERSLPFYGVISIIKKI